MVSGQRHQRVGQHPLVERRPDLVRRRSFGKVVGPQFTCVAGAAPVVDHQVAGDGVQPRADAVGAAAAPPAYARAAAATPARHPRRTACLPWSTAVRSAAATRCVRRESPPAAPPDQNRSCLMHRAILCLSSVCPCAHDTTWKSFNGVIQSSTVRTTASASSRPRSVSTSRSASSQQSVGDARSRRGPFPAAQQSTAAARAQSQPQHHVLDVAVRWRRAFRSPRPAVAHRPAPAHRRWGA